MTSDISNKAVHQTKLKTNPQNAKYLMASTGVYDLLKNKMKNIY